MESHDRTPTPPRPASLRPPPPPSPPPRARSRRPPSDDDRAPDVTLRGVADLVRSVPELVGFVPRESLVLVCVTAGMVGPVMRVDLPAGSHPVRLAVLDDLTSELAARARALLAGSGPAADRTSDRTGVVAVLVSDDGGAAELLPVVAAALHRVVTLLACVLQHRGRALSLDATGRVREQELPVTESSGVLALRSARTLAGRRTLASRGELVASVRPPTGRARDAARQRLALARSVEQLAAAAGHAEPADRLRAARTGLDRLLDAPPDGVEFGRTAARLAVLVGDHAVRDALLARMLRDPDRPWVAALSAALRVLPGAGSEDLTCLLVAMAYRSGDGALAVIAADRVAATVPDHRLTGLLLDLLAAGAPPAVLDDLGELDDGSEDPDDADLW